MVLYVQSSAYIAFWYLAGNLAPIPEITPVGDQKLRIVGYAGVKLFSQTMTWTRAPADLKKCGKAKEEAKPTESTPAIASAEPPASAAPAEAPAPGAAPKPAAPEKAARADVAEPKDTQARAKGMQCTISIAELGKFSFPC